MSTTYTYKQLNNLEIKAELFPTTQEAAPLILYIHGGGLIWGTQNDINKEQVELFNDNGYHVLSIAYRLAPETKIPKIINDIQDSLVWVKEELPQHLDFDHNKVIVMGNSAGGYLALMSGTFENRPDAIISFYGYGNILGDWYSTPSDYFNKMPKVNESLAKQLIQKTETAEAPITARYAIYLYCRQQGVWPEYVTNPSTTDLTQYCPVNLVDQEYPPTLLLHGDADEDVPLEESVNMQKALDEHQVKNKLITIPNGKHQFDENMSDPAVKAAFDNVLQFLKDV
ncbi:alpha/beta hydrolase [Virgibacillus sp. L01]|uniref:alpha/beta hydrolase n=1 Tax=Virgibacillus sp. L01 TaxID=3457429 RepID=UPI003FD1C9CA